MGYSPWDHRRFRHGSVIKQQEWEEIKLQWIYSYDYMKLDLIYKTFLISIKEKISFKRFLDL